MRRGHLILSGIALFSLGGCLGTPKYTQPVENELAQQEASQWWHDFQDPLLSRLIESGRSSGLDILIAETQIDEAKAFTRTQFADLFPSLSLSANSDLTEFPTGTAGLQLNWQVDVFGSLQASVKAARLRSYASHELAKDVRRLISSQIAAVYIQLRARQVERALAEASRERLMESVDRVTRLSESGYATSLDVSRSTRQLNEVSARIEALHGNERGLQNALLELVGDSDDLTLLYDTSVDETHTFPRPAISPPDDEQVFRDRPDIRAAILSVNAEAYERLSARRALYPSITLTGNGSISDTGGTPLNVSSLSSSLIAGLVVPLIGRGRLLGQIDAETAQADRALLQYEQTVLSAVSEVNTAQVQLDSNRAAADEQRKALDEASFSLEQSRRLFEAGEISYLDFLIAEQSRIDSERAFVLSEEAAALAWVQYVSALALN